MSFAVLFQLVENYKIKSVSSNTRVSRHWLVKCFVNVTKFEKPTQLKFEQLLGSRNSLYSFISENILYFNPFTFVKLFLQRITTVFKTFNYCRILKFDFANDIKPIDIWLMLRFLRIVNTNQYCFILFDPAH